MRDRLKLLITGATGFLGSHLTRALLARGHEMIILKRSFSDAWRIADILHDVKAYDIDQTDLALVFEEQGPIQAVIHTATCYGRNNEEQSDILLANTVFPLRLFETASSFGTTTYFNTDTFFGSASGYEYLNGYTLSKKHFVEWARQFADMNRVRFVNIKVEHMYGAFDNDAKFTSHIINTCLENTPELKLTDGEQQRDFIHVDDVVSAFSLLLETVSSEGHIDRDYDLGSGEATPIREFVEMVHRLTGSQTKLRFGALPYRDHDIMHSVANVEALKKLGWSPKYSLEQGLRQTISWYTHNRLSRALRQKAKPSVC